MRDGVQTRRGVQQSGADPVGQVLQDGVMTLAAERHAHQPDGRRGDQQRADGESTVR